MVDFQRKYIPVAKDRRESPRVEFHTPVIVMGAKGKADIVDFSVSGFFIQTDSTDNLKTGQQVNLALKFPHEKRSTLLKAKIVRVEENGFACQFVGLDPDLHDLLDSNFEFLRGTIPIE